MFVLPAPLVGLKGCSPPALDCQADQLSGSVSGTGHLAQSLDTPEPPLRGVGNPIPLKTLAVFPWPRSQCSSALVQEFPLATGVIKPSERGSFGSRMGGEGP